MASKETFARKGTLTSGGVPVQDFVNTRNVDDPANPGTPISADVASQGLTAVDDLGNPTFRALVSMHRAAVAADATVRQLLPAVSAGETRTRWEMVVWTGSDVVIQFGDAASLAVSNFFDAAHLGNGWPVFSGQKDGEWLGGVWQGAIQIVSLGASSDVRVKEYKAVTP